MEQVYERCCGLDVHKDTVVACLRVPGEGVRRHQEVRTFGTTTAELLALGDWLMANRCTHAAMESTGIYWKPGVQSARERVRGDAGQCSPHQGRAGTEDR